MKNFVDFLLWCGMKEVPAKFLMAFLSLIFVVAPLIIGAYNIFYQIRLSAQKMDIIILQQKTINSENAHIKQLVDSLQIKQKTYQLENNEYIQDISKVIEKSSLGTIDIIQQYQKETVNMELIQHIEREIKVMMQENLPHYKIGVRPQNKQE